MALSEPFSIGPEQSEVHRNVPVIQSASAGFRSSDEEELDADGSLRHGSGLDLALFGHGAMMHEPRVFDGVTGARAKAVKLGILLR